VEEAVREQVGRGDYTHEILSQVLDGDQTHAVLADVLHSIAHRALAAFDARHPKPRGAGLRGLLRWERWRRQVEWQALAEVLESWDGFERLLDDFIAEEAESYEHRP
jgi:hypothetical protein